MNSGTPSSVAASLWNGLRSLKLTLVTLFLLAGGSVLGTILPQNLPLSEYAHRLGPAVARIIHFLQLDDMYHSVWFLGLLGLFAVNLGACSLHRLPGVWQQVVRPDLAPSEAWLKSRSVGCRWLDPRPPGHVVQELIGKVRGRFGTVRCTERDGAIWLFAQRYPWARLGAYVTHLAILIILLGGVVGGMAGFRGYVNIAEGQTVDHISLSGGEGAKPLGFGVRCDQFSIDYYENSDRPREFRSLLTIFEDGREVPGWAKVPVRVNHPLRYRGLTFYQSGYGVDAHLFRFIVMPRDGQPFELEVSSDRMALLPDGTSLVIAGYVSDFDGQGPAAGLQLMYPDGRQGRAMAFHDPDLRAAGDGDSYAFRLLSLEQRWYTGLQVSRDPGVPLVWLGCLLLVAGTLAAFYFSHQRVWLLLKSDGDGTRILAAGQSHRHRDAFAKRFETMCHDLQQEASEEPS